MRLLATTSAVVAAAGALPAAASAAECPVTPTSKSFSRFGDYNEYFLAPGGAFNTVWAQRTGWPSLMSGLGALNIAGGVTSLHLARGESVTSPKLCVDRTMPHLRFMAGQQDWSSLEVTVRHYEDAQLIDSFTTTLDPAAHYDEWAPTRNLAMHTGEIPAGESRSATVTIKSNGDWVVDDVYIDPYRR
jgi:hypothetical protein